MPYTTVVSGTVITASWANASVRDQVVTPFATAAARASAITSPVTGMLTYRIDGNTFEGYEGAAWEGVQTRVLARRTVDETLSSNNTLQNDDELFWPVQVGAAYGIDLHLRYTTSATPDMKIGWTFPVGSTMQWSLIANDASLVATVTGDYDQNTVPVLGGNGTALWAHASGIISTAAVAGTLHLQWAQNTSNASNTTMHGASYGLLTRLG